MQRQSMVQSDGSVSPRPGAPTAASGRSFSALTDHLLDDQLPPLPTQTNGKYRISTSAQTSSGSSNFGKKDSGLGDSQERQMSSPSLPVRVLVVRVGALRKTVRWKDG